MPFRGINYYRLRQVDNDGKSDLSKAIAVKIGIMPPELKVTVSETGITAYLYSAAEGKGTIQVSDMMGRLLADKPVTIHAANNTWDIPLTNAKGGIYVLSVVMADGKQLYAKFYK